MRRTFLIVLIVISTFQLYSQDSQFSQYFTTKTLINPAFAGIRPEIEFSTNYKRVGDIGDDNFFELTQASFTYPLKTQTSQEHQIGGLGVSFFKERRGFQGIFTSQKILLTGAYTVRLTQFTNSFLAFGLQGGVVQNKLSDDALNWGSQFNKYYGYDDLLAGETINTDPVYYPTFSAGALYTVYDNENIFIRDKSIILGLSVDNLNRPSTGKDEGGEIKKSTLYKAFGSIKLGVGPRLYFHPSFLALYQANHYQLNYGFYLSTVVNSVRSKTSVLLQIGSWYRQGDSFILLGGLEIQQFKLGASFDLNSEVFTTNEVFRQIGVSYELSLTYTFAPSNRVRKVSNPIF